MPSPSPKQPTIEIPWHDLLGNNQLGLDSVQLSQLTESLFRHASRSIRLSPRSQAENLPFQLRSIPWHDRGYWLSDPSVRPGAYLQYASGQYYIQDAASLLAISLCDLRAGQSVCDLCAAPGGKATAILDKLAGSGFLLANEVIHSRMPLLQAALCRSGWDNFATSQLDADQLSHALPGQFDCVLVDAPCSGQSMVGRDKQSLAAFSIDQVEHSAARQRRIIRSAARLVAPGGRLVYSTCTFAVAENERIIEQFLDDHSGWKLIENPQLQSWACPHLPGTYRLWPHLDDCDGSFAAALIRASDSDETDCTPARARARKDVRPAGWDLKSLDFYSLEHSGAELDFNDKAALKSHQLWQFGDQLHLLKSSTLTGLPSILSGAVPIAQSFASRVEPLYGGAVVNFDGFTPSQSIELTDAQAMAFVRGESISSLSTSLKPGWCQVRWNGWPLAWGKYAGNSLKNHLPKLLRNPSIGAV